MSAKDFPTRQQGHVVGNDSVWAGKLRYPGRRTGRGRASAGKIAPPVIADRTLAWVTANKDRPFFLFYSITLPHERHEINNQGIYKMERNTSRPGECA